MEADILEELKRKARAVGAKYRDRLDRSRRLFVENRAESLSDDRDTEYSIKKEVSEYFTIGYREVCFCGSAQLGFSVHKDRIFTKQVSDLDVACVSSHLYQKAWVDVAATTKAFTDSTAFSGYSKPEIDLFKDQILRRGMIRLGLMPRSNNSVLWKGFEDKMTRKYRDTFKSVSIAFYMNEYAFCWKQDAALGQLIEG